VRTGRGAIKVTNVVSVGPGFEMEKEKRLKVKAQGEFKMAWLWSDGWRARLRAGGDLVEKCRFDIER
jgi:hypothetical protein